MNDLKNIIINSNSLLEGNCIYFHDTFTPYPELYSKQLNLFLAGKTITSRICEIGFNAGHSAMLMLLGRNKDYLDFTIFDIGWHPYTKPCFEYVKNKFSHVNFEYIEGNSIITMPEWISKNQHLIGSYDMVHVDGGHTEECISNDMKNMDLLIKINGIVIIDDTNSIIINEYVNLYVNSGKYIDMNVLPTYGYPHRILKKIK